jgi:hypothetical protein
MVNQKNLKKSLKKTLKSCRIKCRADMTKFAQDTRDMGGAYKVISSLLSYRFNIHTTLPSIRSTTQSVLPGYKGYHP